MTDQIWRIEPGEGPIAATAIHDGGDLREELHHHMALDELSRLREEDPHTGYWTEIVPTRAIGLRSRFEVDLNRPREKAVYRTPEDAWGLQVWNGELPEKLAVASLAEYDAFYDELEQLYGQLAAKHRKFVVYDLHTYNHRRNGPDGPLADAEGNPQVNIGTGTMKDRSRWAGVIDRFKHDLSDYDFPDGKLDVRENVKFFGGNCGRWTHDKFSDAACVLSIEFKKFFMDEWSGQADMVLVEAIKNALQSTVPGVLEELEKV